MLSTLPASAAREYHNTASLGFLQNLAISRAPGFAMLMQRCQNPSLRCGEVSVVLGIGFESCLMQVQGLKHVWSHEDCTTCQSDACRDSD